MKKNNIYIILLVSFVFTCIVYFFFFFKTKTDKQIYQIKEQILCSADSMAYFSLYSNSQEELFPYTLYLGQKFSCRVNYYIYLDILYANNMQEPSEIFFNDRSLRNIDSSIRKLRNSKAGINSMDFEEIFLDSCAKLSDSGYFDMHPLMQLDSVLGIFSIRHLQRAVLNNEALWLEAEISSVYFMGATNFERDSKLAREWYLEYINKDYKKNSMQDSGIIENSLQNVDSIQLPEKSLAIEYITKEIRKGSVFYYELLKLKKKVANTEYEMLLFSLIMANKYHYKKAYWDVYLYLWQTFNYKQKKELWDISGFDPETKELALYHLNKAVSFGNKNAKQLSNYIDKQ